MARIIYSSLVTSINGSAGGSTFQRNLYGDTLKNKPHMSVPRSSFQNPRKQAMIAITQRWKTLDNSQRQTWIDYADTYPYATRLNPSAFLNGYNLFLKFNGILLVAGQPIRQSITQTQYALSITAIGIEDQSGDIIFGFTYSAITDEWRCLVFLSPAILPFSSPRTNKTRFVKDFALTGSTAFTDITAEYIARFGTGLADGDSVYADVTFINTLSGQIIELPTQVITVVPG